MWRVVQRRAASPFIVTTHQMNRTLYLTLQSSLIGSVRTFSSAKSRRPGQIGFPSAQSTSSLNVGNKKNLASATSLDARWMSMYDQYCNYMLHNNGLPPPVRSAGKLGNWVASQRESYRRFQRGEAHSLDENRLRLLQQANFVFDVPEELWLEKYELLLYYQKENGHTRVPVHHDQLGEWVITQRHNYKARLRDSSSFALTQDRIDMLNAVDFCWDMKGEARFREQVLEASASQEETATDGPIGMWRAMMKSRYKKYCLDDDGHNLKDYEIALLEQELGFCHATTVPPVQSVPSEYVSWDERLGQLHEFSDKHGHVNVPRTCTEYPNLGSWVSNVRSRYNKLEPGTADGETQRRIQSLEEIGFIWDVREYKWNLKFGLLVEYHEQFGNADAPLSHPTLGHWVHTQRKQYAKLQRNEKSHMTPPRLAALNGLDFDWKRSGAIDRESEGRFQKRFREYQEHVLSTTGKPMSSILAQWVNNHRQDYRNWLQGSIDLPENRRIALEESGLVNDIIQADK